MQSWRALNSILRRDGDAEAIQLARHLNLAGKAAVGQPPVGKGQGGVLIVLHLQKPVEPVVGDVDMAGAAAGAAAADRRDLGVLAVFSISERPGFVSTCRVSPSRRVTQTRTVTAARLS
jgi:hypothetical protein